MEEREENVNNQPSETTDAAGQSETSTTESETLDPRDTEIAELKAQLEEQKDKYLRLFADFDNFKKRNAKERLELIQTASKDVVLGLLPVLDDFERAIKATDVVTDAVAVKEGVILIYNKLMKALEAKGVKVLDSKGLVFNVEQHEAITEIPVPTADLEGKVIDEVERGYYLNDKLIRFAKVVVGKKAE